MQMDSDGELNEKDQAEIQEFQEKVQDEAQTIFVTKFSDPKEFANFLGIPFSSLQMLMKQHHERDQVISTTIHEHVSFIKIHEGYPQFIYKTDKVQNLIKFTPKSEEIGILDFYESLTVMPKVITALGLAFKELNDVHMPDNGLLT